MKRAELVPYEEKYRHGVIKCLQRNYEWMSNESETIVSKWINPILTYSWSDKSGVDFEHGGVLISEDNVVGFLGMIYSKRKENGKEYVYANPTTWAIDRGYRIYDFSYSKKLYGLADVVSDYTAGKPEQEKAIKIFKFKICDNDSFIFYPSICTNYIKMAKCNEKNIGNEQIKNEYIDHRKYKVDCVKILDAKGDFCYIFLQKKKMPNSRFGFNYVRVLKCSDYSFFNKNMKAIIRSLAFHYLVPYIRVESRFIKDLNEAKRLKHYVIHNSTMLYDPDENLNTPLDLLYTECVILE